VRLRALWGSSVVRNLLILLEGALRCASVRRRGVDFESAASASSAIPAWVLRKSKTNRLSSGLQLHQKSWAHNQKAYNFTHLPTDAFPHPHPDSSATVSNRSSGKSALDPAPLISDRASDHLARLSIRESVYLNPISNFAHSSDCLRRD